MTRFAGPLTLYPARALFTWYLGLIVIGGGLLKLPISGAPDRPPISWLDAYFTATSAACVTGLTVRSTPGEFSFFGQLVILVLIQLGGIGIMTVTTFVALTITGQQSLRHRLAMTETLGMKPHEDVRGIIFAVAATTLAAEGFAALVLTARFALDHPLGKAGWLGCFHAVSAFCNAGFSLFDDSIVGYHRDLTINLTIMALIVVGGLGFPVIVDLRRCRSLPRSVRWERLQLHTKLVLLGTVILMVAGTALFLALEWTNVLSGMPWGTRLLVASFQMVNTRTAGFNSVDISQLTTVTLFVMVLWMFIGAGPCSTAGGFKVSTFMVMATLAWCKLRGESGAHAFRRGISPDTVSRATTSILLYAFVGTVGLGMVLVAEEAVLAARQAHDVFLDTLFEVVSAMGTVGLSTGLTNNLSTGGRLLIMLLMFVGRIGPASLVIVLSRDRREERVIYARDDVLIG